MIPQWLSKPNPEIFLSDNFVVCDFETTNIDYGTPINPNNRIVMSSYYCGPSHPLHDGRIHSVHGGEFQQQELVTAIEQADFLVAQNTKFELQWLTRCGMELHRLLPYDTILGKYVQDGNRRSSRDLNSLASYYAVAAKDSLVSKMINGGVCPSEIPVSLLQRYCEQDVRTTLDVFLKQRKQLHEQGLLPCTFTRNIFTPVLSDMELTGMYLDKDRVTEFYNRYSAELAEINQQLEALTGGINPNSNNQVAEFLYEVLGFEEPKDKKGNFIRNKPNKRFPEGAPKVDAATISSLKARTADQKRFVELKTRQSKLDKSVGTYLQRFIDACENSECIIHGRFNQAVTGTHRLSSSNPNMQNFDRGFKQLFTARKKGWKVGERDAAQLEFRVAVDLGDDEQGREDVRNEEDVHAFTADIIFGSKPTDEDFKIKRTAAKAHTFKPLYGGTSGTRNEKRYYKAFKKKYKGIAEAQDEWVNTALFTKKQVLPTGLVFYWPNIKMTESGYIEGNTNVRNYPVQNLATAEIIPIGVTYTWHHMKDNQLESFLINTVHDSMISEETPEETDIINEITHNAFSEETIDYLSDVYDITFTVPLEIEADVYNNWSSN